MDIRDRIKNVLSHVTADPRVEARWLNTVSMLEHTGARKIMGTVAQHHPSVMVLDHLADETRHALAFKKLALEVLGEDPEEYIARSAARNYFRKLDGELSAWLRRLIGRDCMYENYLLVTTMIERRAMILYPLYRAASENRLVHDELKQIIAEEQDHRVAIEENCLSMLQEFGVRSMSVPEAVESAYFSEFLTALETELGVNESIAA